MYDICIVGAGAAGLACAINAARHAEGRRICLLEAQDRVGRKLLATGNGRCNIANSSCSSSDYYSGSPEGVRRVLESLTSKELFSFLSSIGIELINEQGRLYPSSETAASVVDMLRFELTRLGVELISGFRAVKAARHAHGFIISDGSREIKTSRLVLACGGAAAPSLGGSERCTSLAVMLGHSSSVLRPVLTQLLSPSPLLKSLKGTRTKCTARLYCGKKLLAAESGEVLFAEKSLSGIAVFQLSRHFPKSGSCSVSLRLLPDMTDDEIAGLIRKRAKTLGHLSLEVFLTGLFSKLLGVAVMKAAQITNFGRKVNTLDTDEIKRIHSAILDFRFQVSGLASWNQAQVTRGGVSLAEFFPESLESRKVQGLYCIGEMLDVDGPCGGYNLEWALSTGLLAGKMAAESIIREV